MRLRRPGYGAKEKTMNIREAAAKFKTDEDCPVPQSLP